MTGLYFFTESEDPAQAQAADRYCIHGRALGDVRFRLSIEDGDMQLSCVECDLPLPDEFMDALKDCMYTTEDILVTLGPVEMDSTSGYMTDYGWQYPEPNGLPIRPLIDPDVQG